MLLPDMALADQEVADRLAGWGYPLEAVAPAEEAVNRYREVAAASPSYLPDLATALNNLSAFTAKRDPTWATFRH